ncbi:MAG: ATP-binding protein [Nitrososphaera sp.]
MVLSSELFDDNPWWKSADEINKDPQIKEWEESIVKWDPKIRQTFDYTKDIVYSLRGPRQVGKTTLVKLQIRTFLRLYKNPWNIFYYAFDVDNTPKDLVNIIKNYLDNTKRQRGNKRCYLFLDEVSSIKDWQKGIKRLWDQNKLQNCTIVATGSHSIDLKMSNERLPGRRGITDDAYDKIMPPMKFSEYISCIDNNLRKIITNQFTRPARLAIFRRLAEGEINKKLDDLQAHLPDLNRYLEDYLLTGGIPKVIDEYMRNKYISEAIYTRYLDSILGDLSSLSRSHTLFKQLAGNLIKTIGWPASWHSLQKDTDIGSVNTVVDHVSTLHDMFILSVFYQYDSQKKKPLFEKEKKIFFHDPFFLHALNSWINNQKAFELSQAFIKEPTNQGSLVEGIIGDHLIRLAFGMSEKKQTFDYSNVLYYWKYEKQKEVDFILNDGVGLEIPIEVRFQNSITNRDLDGLINFKKFTGVKNALLITKDQLDLTNECVKIPAATFLLLI